MFVEYLMLAAAALVAGVMNAVAGGGSLVTFPTLVFSGVPPVIANASSTVALLPGAFASAWAYREDRRNLEGVSFTAALTVSVAGGIGGAILLLSTPEQLFDLVIPWLLLLATIAFAVGPRISTAFGPASRSSPAILLAAQFLIAIYGGYFGGAVGLIMLAAWGLLGMRDINMMNANKTLLGGSMNCAAVVLFILAGIVWWPQTLVMLAGSITGGYFGARVARRMNPVLVRGIIIGISVFVTVAFFLRETQA